MEPLSISGILVSVFMALCGLFLILCGGVMGFLGMWVDGPFESIWLRLYGVGLFLLGIVYVAPVLAFPKRSYVLAYLLCALCTAAFAVWAFASDPRTTGGTWIPVLIYGGMLVFFPALLSITALLRF